MGKIYTIANQKGGVGKSTMTHTLASGLAMRNKKVLLCDMDPQSNLSMISGATTDAMNQKTVTMLEVLCGDEPIEKAIQHKENFDVIPASMFLASIDSRLMEQISRHYKLQEALKTVKKNYDYIFIDTPPALGTLTANAVVASDFIIIPAQADILSLQGVSQLYATIQSACEHCNPSLKISGIVFTRYKGKTNLTKEMRILFENAAKQMNTTLFKQTIREAVAVAEGQAQQKSIIEYDPKSKVASDYNALIDEIFGKVADL